MKTERLWIVRYGDDSEYGGGFVFPTLDTSPHLARFKMEPDIKRWRQLRQGGNYRVVPVIVKEAPRG